MVQSAKRPNTVADKIRRMRDELHALGLTDDELAPMTLAADRVADKRGITLNAAASKYDVPQDFLWRWAEDNKIEILQRATRAGGRTIVNEDDVVRVADIYHRAKEQGIQPKRLWKLMNLDN